MKKKDKDSKNMYFTHETLVCIAWSNKENWEKVKSIEKSRKTHLKRFWATWLYHLWVLLELPNHSKWRPRHLKYHKPIRWLLHCLKVIFWWELCRNFLKTLLPIEYKIRLNCSFEIRSHKVQWNTNLC